jgi:DMSO/TMAO reductase YedYZ molybdopterin-dependent catalytic subunit
MDPHVVLAYEMGGATLPPDHGFPARLLVPGIYGMKHVKWLNSIELVNYDYKGYWQQPSQGWSDVATVHTMSKIDYPASGTLKLRQQTLAGVAFAGDRSISKVEVSTDAGKSWNQAFVKPKQSDTSWVVWAFSWTPPATGRYTVIVRATDGQGNLQRGRVTDPYPNGASGWHTVVYHVSG